MKSMFFDVIKNSLLRSYGQKFLTFLTIFLSVALIACMLNITLKIGNEVAKELRSYGSNIIITPKSESLSIEIGDKSYSPLKSEDYLKESDLHLIKEIFWQNNIVGFAPFLSTQVELKDGKEYQLTGTYFDKQVKISDDPDYKTGVKAIFPFWSVDGNYPADDSLDEVLVGEGLAQRLGYKIGDNIDISGKKVKISGILKEASDYNFRIISSLKFVQDLLNKPNLINKVEVSAMTIPEDDLSLKARKNVDSLDAVEHDAWYCSAYVSSIAYQITEEYPGSIAKAVLSVSETQSGITKKIQSLMGVVSILALIVSAIGVTSLLSSEIYSRKKEIGLLKALGATNFDIYLQFITETLVVGIISSIFGAIFGYLLSFAIGYQLFSTFIGISIMVLPLSIAFGIFICIVGSFLPLRSVMNLLPAEVLYGRK